MAKQQTDAADDDADDVDEAKLEARGQDISKRRGIKKALIDVYNDVEKGFTDQSTRADDQLDYWEIYNCELGGKQMYTGNAKIFVPIVHNAVNARKTRFANQIFPISGRYVEVTSENGDIPHGLMALLEHYVRRSKLRLKAPAFLRNGDVEGQYSVYVSWEKNKRHVTFKTKQQPEIEDTGLPNPAAEAVDDVKSETISSAYPAVEVLHDSDILVLPHTSDSLEEAISSGGSVTIIRRWGKAKIRRMVKDGAIRKDEGDSLVEEMNRKTDLPPKNQSKQLVDAAGIHGEGTKYALVYETWTHLDVHPHNEPRLCQAFFGGKDRVLGCRLNPNWSDKLPLLSVPVEKTSGVFKGVSKVKPCADMQYFANDAINEAADSATYGLMPIVMTDPEKNPRVGSMVLSLASIWETSPKDTQILQFPQLWQHGFEMVSAAKSEIAQTLSVSPAAITQGTGTANKAKPSQAQVAQEQQIDILTTADAVTVVEEGILTPLLERFIELDHQYRDDAITVRQYGEMGVRANMQEIAPIQMDKRYHFRWFGVEAARNAQQVQQQIAMMNVIRGIPPQQYEGHKIDMVPLISQLVENTFGPRLAPLIFKDMASQMPVPVTEENMLLSEGFEVPTHEMDDDDQHIQAHMAFMQQMQEIQGAKNAKKFQVHIFAHMQQKARKQQAVMQQQSGEPGIPGGAGPGVAGTPRSGGQPGMPRGGQGPAGMIHQDQLHDPMVMPRKM